MGKRALLASLLLGFGAQAGQGTFITVTGPAAGTTLGGGTSTSVTWSTDATSPHEVKLDFRCGGATAGTFTVAAQRQPTPGSAPWVVPFANSSACRVLASVVTNAGAATPVSGQSGVFAIDSQPPALVTAPSAAATPGQVTLSWTNPADPDFAQVRVYRALPGALPQLLGSRLKTDVPPNRYVDSTAVAGQRYRYYLASVDALGNAQESVRADAPSPNAYGAGVATDGVRLFSFGGDDASSSGSPDVWAFDPASDRSTKLDAGLGLNLFHPRAVWVGGATARVLLFGGWSTTARSDIRAFNPANETVTLLASGLPAPRTWGAAVYAPSVGRVFYFGGNDNSFVDSTTVFYREITSYDPATGATATVGQLPAGRSRFFAVYWPADQHIYLFGGAIGLDVADDQVFSFDPADGGLSLKGAKLPRPLSELAAVSSGQEIILAGGLSNLAYRAEGYAYDPSRDAIEPRFTLPAAGAYQAADGPTGGIAVFSNPFPFANAPVRFLPGAGPVWVSVPDAGTGGGGGAGGGGGSGSAGGGSGGGGV
ncbi:MAG: hypothetical protein K1X89_29890, partial [Myxococcaceae bacterium]|nr:hypothetical protein [Myxococcaceae bacterium]